MKKIEISELNDNVFTTIGKEWMLVTAGTKDNFNMMTASWGCLGWLWNKPVAVMFIRPERYTHGLIEQTRRVQHTRSVDQSLAATTTRQPSAGLHQCRPMADA